MKFFLFASLSGMVPVEPSKMTDIRPWKSAENSWPEAVSLAKSRRNRSLPSFTRAWLMVPSATSRDWAGNRPFNHRKPDSIQLRTFWQFRSRRTVRARTNQIKTLGINRVPRRNRSSPCSTRTSSRCGCRISAKGARLKAGPMWSKASVTVENFIFGISSHSDSSPKDTFLLQTWQPIGSLIISFTGIGLKPGR